LYEFSSFGEEEVFHIIEGVTIFGVLGDEVACVEQGIEFLVKEITNGEGLGIHHVRLCKNECTTLDRVPLKFNKSPVGLQSRFFRLPHKRGARRKT